MKVAGTIRGQRQTAYQVLVASSTALLDQGRGDIWDSGKVDSSQSALVPFAGKTLVSNEDCYWKVRVWDKDKKVSAWSAPARFSMGLLQSEDWTGPWIQYPGISLRPLDRGVDLTEAVSSLVINNELVATAATALSKGVDPASGIYKKLIVSYTIDGIEGTAAVVDGHKLRVVAPAGKALAVKRALYGDFPYPVLDVTERLKGTVANDQLSFPVDPKSFAKGADLAPGKTRSLRVSYQVAGRPHSVTLAEGDGAVLRLPAAADGSGPLTIESAVFGDLDASLPPAMSLSLVAPDRIPAAKHLWFRKDFSLEKPARSALLHVASVGYHELYVNGKKVDDRVLAPALTRLDKRVLYVTYDIAKLLQPGANTIALWTGPGWARYAPFATLPALRVQLNAQTDGGKVISLASDTTWRCAISCSENTGKTQFLENGGEKIDARNEVPQWNSVGFDDCQWKHAVEASIVATLSAQMVEPTRVIETIPAQSISGTGPYKVDMGKNFTGWINIKMNGQSPGDLVTIKVADDSETVQDFGQNCEYLCKGEAGELFRDRFNYIAGRYITIEGLKAKPQLADITGLALGTDLERVGHFSCSKELFNQIYETDLWTYRVNTTEAFTMDCPHRERLGYGEVAFACAWGIGLPNYEVGALYTKNVRDWMDVQKEDGWTNHTAPQSRVMYGGAMWSSAGLNISWELYQTYGDTRLLEMNYPSSKRWLDFLNSNAPDGILHRYGEHPGHFLGDWAAPGPRTEYGNKPEAEYFNNCVYAMNLAAFIKMAQVLGHSQDVALYSQRLKDLKEKVQAKFFDKETNSYSKGNQVQQAFALLTGITPENLRPAVASTIEKDITQTHPYLDMGSPSVVVLLKYFTEYSGRGGLLFEPLSKTTMPSYGYFLSLGESAWPEYWKRDVPSRMHTCYTGIASWFIKCLAGIRPDPAHPGYQSFLIEPTIAGDLTFAEASTQSLYGPIASRWERKGNSATLKVTVPPNSQATVTLPTSDEKSVKEGGKGIRQAKGVSLLRKEGNHVVVHVESGIYEFSFSAKPG